MGGGGWAYRKRRASHVLRQGVGCFLPGSLGHEPDGTVLGTPKIGLVSALCWPDESRIRGNRLRRRRPSRIVAREWAGRNCGEYLAGTRGGGGQGNLGMLGRMGRMAMSGVRVSRYAQRVSLTSVPGSACWWAARGDERGGRWASRHYSVCLPNQSSQGGTRTWVPGRGQKQGLLPRSGIAR